MWIEGTTVSSQFFWSWLLKYDIQKELLCCGEIMNRDQWQWSTGFMMSETQSMVTRKYGGISRTSLTIFHYVQ